MKNKREIERETVALNEMQLMAWLSTTGNEILKKINETKKNGDTSSACDALYHRIVLSGNTLMLLREQGTQYDWTYDGSSIIRIVYEASLQILYILNDESSGEEIARRYLDFAIIERVKMIRLFDKRATDFSSRLSQSSKRAEVENVIYQEFRRVCKKYNYDSRKPPQYWHQGTTRNLAIEVGVEGEFELLQKQLSSIIHCSFTGIREMPRYDGNHLLMLYWKFAFRALGKIAEHVDVQLTNEQEKVILDSYNSIFDDANG